jgi:hypothetical protein
MEEKKKKKPHPLSQGSAVALGSATGKPLCVAECSELMQMVKRLKKRLEEAKAQKAAILN